MSDKTKKTFLPSEKQRQEASNVLHGWPGYRTRDGRSGLDPLDTRAEAGHMAGVFVRRLLTGNLRTNNPFFLFSLAVVGILLASPLLLAIVEVIGGDLFPPSAWLVLAIPGLVGALLLVSLVKNLIYFRRK